MLRIGAFSQDVGIPAAVLRAWESRYGLFTPARTAGGYRLYGAEERRRVQRMRAYLTRGVAVAESAQLVLSEPQGSGDDLAEAWSSFDPLRAQRALDAVLDAPEPEVAAAALLPLLAELTPEHGLVARRMVETRLLALSERWHEGPGRLALAGCGPGEHDTLPVIVCALALHRRGWRIVYLGPDTPAEAFARAAEALAPAAIVITGTLDGLPATAVGDDPLGIAASL